MEETIMKGNKGFLLTIIIMVLMCAGVITALFLAYRAPVPHVLRLKPGEDIQAALQSFVDTNNIKAASIVTGIGSLTDVGLRYANKEDTTRLKGHFEIVSLSGMVSRNHTHIHLAVSDGEGRTYGGHVKEGNLIYTTGEITLLEYPLLNFIEEKCRLSGYDELSVKKRFLP